MTLHSILKRWRPYRRFRAVNLFLSILWRKWDELEYEDGTKQVIRMSWSASWDVAKIVWLNKEESK